MGHNMIAAVPKLMATFLKLENTLSNTVGVSVVIYDPLSAEKPREIEGFEDR